MTRFTLSKQERLSSLKDIDLLFADGKSLVKYPIRLVWRHVPASEPVPVSALFSVSKKKFSRAVDRNRIKRLLRESYRLLKPSFFASLPADQCYHIGLIYVATEILDLDSIQKSLSVALDRLTIEITQKQ